jgi:hypothetical protein
MGEIMDKETAIKLIQVIVDSLENNTSQFNFEINVVGTSVVNKAPGIGMAVNASGGGLGSTTIGLQSSVSASDVKISQKRANKEIQRQITELTTNLRAIIDELKKPKPDENKIKGFFQSLVGKWIPDVITKTIGGILAAFGIKLVGG